MIRRVLLITYVYIQDLPITFITRYRRIHRYLFLPVFEPYRWAVGRWGAMRTFYLTRRTVPAYRDYLKAYPAARVKLSGLMPDFSLIPEMDKESYIKRYSIEDRCRGGKLPRYGVMVDESSGSTGHPTSWVRGIRERRYVKNLLQLTFSIASSGKPVFVLNAFSLGAWATGMNVSMSLIDICIMKSTGPDITKIIDTIKEFGPNYSYIVMGYPPFLKDLVDDTRITFGEYDVMAGYGGEGMSEHMRDYLLNHFTKVFGSYGASDIEINVAAENDFTVALRRALMGNQGLRDQLTVAKYGVLPMLFQYNPYEYVLETNEKGELLATIARDDNINPRIRYNVHDRGHVIRFGKLAKILREHGELEVLQARQVNLPVLFYYGRSDLTVDYYGAKVPPDPMRDLIFADGELVSITHTFRLITYETIKAAKYLLFALELNEGTKKSSLNQAEIGQRLIKQLRSVNRDFDNACKTAAADMQPLFKVYDLGTGPFHQTVKKLKNEYVWQLNHEQAQEYGLVD